MVTSKVNSDVPKKVMTFIAYSLKSCEENRILAYRGNRTPIESSPAKAQGKDDLHGLQPV